MTFKGNRKMQNFKKIVDEEWSSFSVPSKESLSKHIVYILLYPGRFVPVCDKNGELSGAIDKEKIKKIPAERVKNISIASIKENAPFVAYHTIPETVLLQEMEKKKIQNIFLIDRRYQYKGSIRIELPTEKNPIKNIFDRLFELSLNETKAS